MESNKRKPIPKAVRAAKYAETIICHYCGKKTTKRERHLDHIVPVESGGTNDPSNLVVSCKQCNTRKSTREYGSFIEREIERVRVHLETLLALKADK